MSLIDTNCPIAWPTIEETEATDDWEVVDPSSFSSNKSRSGVDSRMPKSISTPDFGLYTFEEESFSNSGDSANEESVDACVVVDDDNGKSNGVIAGDTPIKVMKRVPSFKDAILLNAEECEKDAEAKKKQELQQSSRRTLPNKRVPTFAVKKISRNAKSMTDLASLAEGDEDVCGDTDAAEFYARKSKGSSARASGIKLRPDEAKRREYIIYKKNMQRAGNR